MFGFPDLWWLSVCGWAILLLEVGGFGGLRCELLFLEVVGQFSGIFLGCGIILLLVVLVYVFAAILGCVIWVVL